MKDYSVEFVTSMETRNPWRAAQIAENEVRLSRTFLVYNQTHDKFYEVRLATGEILCPDCGSDINKPNKDCDNCIIVVEDEVGESIKA